MSSGVGGRLSGEGPPGARPAAAAAITITPSISAGDPAEGEVAASPPPASAATEAAGSYGGSLMRLNSRPFAPAGDGEWDDGYLGINPGADGLDEPLLVTRRHRSWRPSQRSSRPSTPPLSGPPSRQISGPLGTAPGPVGQGRPQPGGGSSSAFQSAMFGCLNAVITIPVMIAFCKVIFKEPEFAPYQGKLTRLVFLSAATHQLVFMLRSCVPGAVGQVQDVGLIFLSAMASSVVEAGRQDGAAFADTMATCLVLLSAATLAVGVLVIIVARLRVASVVQYVPVPVVGGYLAFVGYFVCVSGMQLATNVPLASPADFLHLFKLDAIARALPAIGTWQLLHHTVRNVPSPAALPAALLAVIALFYTVMLASGHSVADAQAAKWMPLPEEPMPRFYEVWGLYKLGEWPGCINWASFPSQLPNLLALFMVVAFGSCMDIAAIQAQYDQELDFDNELELIGISNLVTGLGGVGYTGSYIFSQTLFNMKHGVSGRLTGAIIVASEVAMFLLPSSPVQFVPNFFFGGLMLWIGVDIMYDWLVMSWAKLRGIEYAIIWLTLMAVTLYGLEGGILIGIVAALASFAFEYSKLSVTCFNVAASRSSYIRTFRERDILDRMSSNMVAVSLSGYVFFGSATIMSEKVLMIADLLKTTDWADDGAAPGVEVDATEAKLSLAKAAAPKTLLLDFRKVTGLDATAAQALNVLRQRLDKKGVDMIIAHIPPSRLYIQHLLVAHGVAAAGVLRGPPEESVAPGSCLVFDSLSTALQYCEEALLCAAVQFDVCPPTRDNMSLSAVLEANRALEWREKALLPVEMVEDMAQVEREMLPFLDEVEFMEAGVTLFSRGDEPSEIFIIQSGLISCQIERTYARSIGHRSHMLLHTMQHHDPQTTSRPHPLYESDESSRGRLRSLWQKLTGGSASGSAEDGLQNVHLAEYGSGGFLGDLDFFLQRPRSFEAKVVVAPCKLWRLSRTNLIRMSKDSPRSCMVLQMMILRASALSGSHAVEALEMASL